MTNPTPSHLLGAAGALILATLVLAACTEEPSGLSEAAGDQVRNACPPLHEMPIGKIAYTRVDADGLTAIYLMNPDGSEPTCLVDTQGDDLAPAWSPDGTIIAFESDADGDHDLYLVRADGSALSQLTDADGNEADPSWSPDGEAIVFDWVAGDNGPFAIRTVRAEGTGMRTVIASGDRWAWVGGPIWSPDGSTIAFGATEGGYGGAYAMDPDGSNVRLLTDGEGDDSVSAWSPDGRQIAFVADRDGGCIFLMNSDGSQVTRLTRGCAEGFDITWAPDGEQIAWAGGSHGPADAFVMDIDGDRTVLIDDSATAAYLAWQPT